MSGLHLAHLIFALTHHFHRHGWPGWQVHWTMRP